MRSFSRFLLGGAVLVVLAFVPVVSAEGDYSSEMLGPGETYSFTFDARGSSYYHCHPHPLMEGRITIDPSDGAAPQTHVVKIVESGTSQGSWGFEPAQLTVKAGDTVQWVNEGQEEHQVMGWLSEDPDDDHAGHDHGDHGHDHDHPVEESPVGLVFPLLGALGLAALLRRR